MIPNGLATRGSHSLSIMPSVNSPQPCWLSDVDIYFVRSLAVYLRLEGRLLMDGRRSQKPIVHVACYFKFTGMECSHWHNELMLSLKADLLVKLTPRCKVVW